MEAIIDGIKYELNLDTKSATLISNTPKYKGDINIPSCITHNSAEYSVTSIGDGAFRGCSLLTSITIPNSVTSIRNYAFGGCSSLESIIIPKGVLSIGHGAFQSCTSLTTILLSNTITTISAYAFWSCSSLSSIVIPNSVKTIEEGTFDYCYALSYIIIPNSVTCIKDGFYHCKSLSSIIIPASVEKIKAPLFMHCSSLISINVERGNIHYDSRDNCNAIIETKTNTLIAGCQNTVIPQSVVNIGFKAFAFRNTLKSIIIPRNITCIQESAFESCSSISSIVVEDDNNYYDSRNNCNAIIETATNKLILGCQNTIIPNTVKTIGYQAFYNCSFLTSIIIPDGVVSIEKEAFCNCHSLEAITIPKTLNSIGYGVLQNSCTIEKITNYSFIDIQKYATALGLADFEINGLLIRRDGVVGCKKNIKSVNIPDGIRQVSSNAFINCTALESITFPNSINDCCLIDLDSCTSLKEISIPKGKRAKFLEIGLKKYNDKIVESNDEEVSILLNIAKGYELGIGMAKNLAQAVLIYNQAAEKGCAEAAYHLGELYEKGEGLPQDYQCAIDWYTKAVSLYHPSAEERKKHCEQILQKEVYVAECQFDIQKSKQTAKYIFFDTECNGLPRNKNLSISATSNWPRMIQLAWLVTDEQGSILKSQSHIICPQGFIITNEVENLTGITTSRAKSEGVNLRTVLNEFMDDLVDAELVIGHNIDFDKHVLGCELYRERLDYDALFNKESVCTMQRSTNFCAIPNPNSYYGGYKWPKLEELYQKLFNTTLSNAHDALSDVEATRKCYFELKKQGIF